MRLIPVGDGGSEGIAWRVCVFEFWVV